MQGHSLDAKFSNAVVVTSLLLVSVATILLRCAIDTTDATVAERCKGSLKALQKRLHLAKSQDNWDLADEFIRRCDEPISKVTASSDTLTRDHEASAVPASQAGDEIQYVTAQQEVPGFGMGMHSDLSIPLGPLDYPWEPLWDMLEGSQGNI